MAPLVVSRDPALVQLESWIERIWDQARAFGLDPYPTHFEIFTSRIILGDERLHFLPHCILACNGCKASRFSTSTCGS